MCCWRSRGRVERRREGQTADRRSRPGQDRRREVPRRRSHDEDLEAECHRRCRRVESRGRDRLRSRHGRRLEGGMEPRG